MHNPSTHRVITLQHQGIHRNPELERLTFEEYQAETRARTRFTVSELQSEGSARLLISNGVMDILTNLNLKHGRTLRFIQLNDSTKLRELCDGFDAGDIRTIIQYIKTNNPTMAHLSTETIMEMRIIKDIVKLSHRYILNND